MKINFFIFKIFVFFLYFNNIFAVKNIKVDNITIMDAFMSCFNGVWEANKKESGNFLILGINDYKKAKNIYDLQIELNSCLFFKIDGCDEKNIKDKYKIDNHNNTDKNKKFQLKLDLNNETLQIQEITDYDKINKKNILSENIFTFDLEDFTNVIFKLTYRVKKKVMNNTTGEFEDQEVDEDKYVFCNDCNSCVIDKTNIGMFCSLPKESHYKISVEWVSKNKNKWTDISGMFSKNNNIEEIDFGNFDYKFKNISSCFSECENLKIVKNLKKVFNDDLEEVKYVFDCCKKIDNIDISNVKLPEDSSCLFSCSSIKNLKYDNLDCSKCKNLNSFFWGSDIEEFDFNNLKNTENIEDLTMFFCDCEKLKKVIFNDIKFPKLKEMEQMFNSCQILDEIIGFENVKLEVKSGNFLFYRCNSLKKLNLSNLVITDNNNKIVDFRYIKDLILPNDKNSAEIIINYIKEFFNRTYGKNLDNKFNIYYKNQKLENVSQFDDFDKFIEKPDDYINNRDNILKTNEENYKKSLKNLNEDTLKAAGCCSKCCANCNNCCK